MEPPQTKHLFPERVMFSLHLKHGLKKLEVGLAEMIMSRLQDSNINRVFFRTDPPAGDDFAVNSTYKYRVLKTQKAPKPVLFAGELECNLCGRKAY